MVRFGHLDCKIIELELKHKNQSLMWFNKFKKNSAKTINTKFYIASKANHGYICPGTLLITLIFLKTVLSKNFNWITHCLNLLKIENIFVIIEITLKTNIQSSSII